MFKKKILITGISGMLGSNLAYCLRKRYAVAGWFYSQPVEIPGVDVVRVDINDRQQVIESIEAFNPDVVIHCAAQANVDTCEEKPKEAHKINVVGTRNLAQSLNLQTKLIYISSDLVYDGEKGNYSEKDKVQPLNVYGKTKVDSERIVSKVKHNLILRTNFFGWNVRHDKFSFAEWVIHELKQSHPVLGFKDVRFSSIYTFDLANIIDTAIQRNVDGVFNCGSRNSILKYHFLKNIAKKVGLSTECLRMISVDKVTLKAKRSKNLSLDVKNLSMVLGIKFPTIEETMNRFVRDYKKKEYKEIKSFFREIIYPQLDFIPYTRQSIDFHDIKAVEDVLKSAHLTQGSKISEFEQALCKVTSVKFSIAVNSGTSALHLACLAAGVKAGDEVITSPNSFVASANCILYCGGNPIFADIREDTYNINLENIKAKITSKTKAVVPVHFAGQSCDMKSIQAVVRQKEKEYGHKIFIIEDACHALGSEYQNKPVGSCCFSDMAVMSFHPAKHITTGEGGAIFTNDEKLEKQMKLLRSHGITSNKEEFVNPSKEYSDDQVEKYRWYYEQQVLGFNYRITDIQCALGLSQLKKLPSFIKQRRKIVNFYNKAFAQIPHIVVPLEKKECQSNFHLYVLLFDFKKVGVSRSTLIQKLLGKRILTQVHYIPIHTQPFYRKTFNTSFGQCPNAEEYYQKCLSLPLSPDMTLFDAHRVAEAIQEIIGDKVK